MHEIITIVHAPLLTFFGCFLTLGVLSFLFATFVFEFKNLSNPFTS
jgi:hypothetical protein